MSVCLSVCLHAYLTNLTTESHRIFCVPCQWPQFGPILAALQYVMYFRFYGLR